MTDSDKPEFLKLLMAMAELFQRNLSESAIEMYFQALRDYDIRQIQNAAGVILKTKTFHKFPLPGEFIEVIEPQFDPEVRATQVLEIVFDAMESYGAYATVQFDDPVIHKVIEYLGGWAMFVNGRRECKTDTQDRFWRMEFTKAYRHFSQFTDPNEEIKPMPGILETDNVEFISVGLAKRPEPILIATRTRRELPAPNYRLLDSPAHKEE
jgi:hypothetical protein